MLMLSSLICRVIRSFRDKGNNHHHVPEERAVSGQYYGKGLKDLMQLDILMHNCIIPDAVTLSLSGQGGLVNP